MYKGGKMKKAHQKILAAMLAVFALVSMSPPAARAAEKKEPVVAFLLSFVLPGAGQYYNGQIVKGVVQTTLAVGGLAAALAKPYDTTTTTEEFLGVTITTTERKLSSVFYAGLATTLVADIWSMIDAPIWANKINKRKSLGHLFEVGNERLVLGVDLGPRGGMLSFHF